jgi:hypothetical protein
MWRNSVYVVKVKEQLSLRLTKHYAMKTYLGSGGIDPHILLTRHYMVVSDQVYAPPTYPQGKSLRYPFDRRLGGPQNRSGHGVEERNFQPPAGIEHRSSDRPARSQSLYRLSYPGPHWKCNSYIRNGIITLDARRISSYVRRCIQKFPDWPPGARTASGTALCH